MSPAAADAAGTVPARDRTLVIIPALNEEQSLPAVLAALRSAGWHHVLVVDDGSRDRTAAQAARGGAMVARLPFNLGVGGAMRTGFRFAARRGYQRAVQFDADGQHRVDDIPRLLQRLDEGADMAVGSRFAAAERTYQQGRVRAGAMGMLRVTITLLSGRRFSDTSSGFRAYSASLIDFFADAFPLEYLSDTVESLLLACYAGFSVVEVPVTMRVREAGRPSTRHVRLVYHYLRVMLVLASMASRRSRRLGRVAA
ncbi:MAG: glycosyltransferase family 2 protein [Candidatus Dormibacteraeota bacterium]|nr:glycosyltransferase family 2 protein [Candidatus Dormibacteraeota bacterium]MBV8444670.1 glycosyltransferase family 2 protein [Candidatus Dormibacteraeota bacterium]